MLYLSLLSVVVVTPALHPPFYILADAMVDWRKHAINSKIESIGTRKRFQGYIAGLPLLNHINHTTTSLVRIFYGTELRPLLA